MKIVSEHWAKYIFATAINSPCKQFCEGIGEGERDRPREMKRSAVHIYSNYFSNRG